MRYDLIQRDLMYRGQTLEVRRERYELENGKNVVQEFVETWDGVAIIPILPNGNIVLTKQHRYALNKDSLEIPGGGIKGNETEINAAIRELKEETGYSHKTMRQITKFDVSSGYLTEEVSIFVADIEKQQEAQSLDADEDIQILEFSQNEIYKLLQNGSITDSKTLLALMYLFSFDREFKRQR